jgi:proteasome lid subunit RPN8/RPN11
MSRRSTENERNGVAIGSDVIRQIRQHARSSIKTEVCGVLVGRENTNGMEVEACISGLNAEQAGAHVTFTQDTWEHIYKVKDQQYPDLRIVGWYHSHPGFGIFLSDHDTFIHKNFFSSPRQIAWVCDPHSDEEGCFGWVGGRIERLTQIRVIDREGGSVEVGGRPEPVLRVVDDQPNAGERWVPEAEPVDSDTLSLTNWTVTILSHMSLLLLGLMIGWYVFPRVVMVPVPVDPFTGRPLVLPQTEQQQPESSAPRNNRATPPAPSGKPGPAEQRKEAHEQR